MTNGGFTKRGLISKKVPAPIVRIADASIAMIWETSHEEVVDTIFVGKDWQYDRRSLHMCSRYSRQPYRLDASARPRSSPIAVASMSFVDNKASASKTCLVRFDSNKYSVSVSAVGRPVDVHSYADRIVVHWHTGVDAD